MIPERVWNLWKITEFINYYSKITSIELSKERGRMPYFDKSFYPDGKLPFSGFKDKNPWHFDWKEIADKNQEIRHKKTVLTR